MTSFTFDHKAFIAKFLSTDTYWSVISLRSSTHIQTYVQMKVWNICPPTTCAMSPMSWLKASFWLAAISFRVTLNTLSFKSVRMLRHVACCCIQCNVGGGGCEIRYCYFWGVMCWWLVARVMGAWQVVVDNYRYLEWNSYAICSLSFTDILGIHTRELFFGWIL